jgi:riboflavin synthase
VFTGIVEECGEVLAMEGGRLTVACRTVVADSDIGASIAVNGVCLTVVERTDRSVAFDVSPETLDRTSLREIASGRSVNLERPTTLAARLGGHLVQGHVDGTGTVRDVLPDGAGGARLRIEFPSRLLRYVVEKGSIAVDGVSLTVAALHEDGITIALIPHTLSVTTLGAARPGDRVNLEVDVIARYVERLTERSGG